MNDADIIQTCDRLSQEVYNLEDSVRDRADAIAAVRREAAQLESAKIALRVEFGQPLDTQRQAQLDAALKDLTQRISALMSEEQKLSQERGVLADQLRQANSAHGDLGCASLRRA